MKFVAGSFGWPFRGAWRPTWALGLGAVLLLPILFVPLLGYAVAATRAAEGDPEAGPPAWHLSGRLLSDGLWTAASILLASLPFALAFSAFSSWLYAAHIWRAADVSVSQAFAHMLALCMLALPWGLVMLLLMPHGTAIFAASGKPADLFNYAATIRRVREDFATWNLAAAAIVTAWAAGIACAGVLCIGAVPGVFYAILVSAHASAALNRTSADPPTR